MRVLAVDWGRIGEDYGPPVTRVLALLVVTWVIARFVVGSLATRMPEKVRRQASYVLPKVVWVFGILMILGSVGININSLLAVMATVGIGAALVFTPVGQNLIAGFLAGIDDVVREGDVIGVGESVGTVVRKGSLSLGVLMPDGAMVYMPNTRAVDDELVNHTRSDGVRIEAEIKLDGSPDRARAVAVMEAAVEGLHWRRHDLPAAVLFSQIGASALHYRCLVWIDSRLDEPKCKSQLLTSVTDALEAADISVGETNSISLAHSRVTDAVVDLTRPGESV